MRIGIFTIYLANYGAVLQAYALKKSIERINPANIVEVVDFYTHSPYKIFKTRSTNPIKNFIKNVLVFTHYFELRRRNNREIAFLNKYMNLSSRVEYHEKEFESICPQYDIYLTGSDQVFNPNSPYTKVFYQQFSRTNGIRAAYASSFGLSNLKKNLPKQYLNYLREFDYLSCREDDGALFMREVTSQKVPQVIDPTLLLSKEEWDKIAVVPDFSGYLLSYNLNGGQPLLDYATKLARLKNLQHVCITQHAEQILKGPDKIIFDAGPGEFIGLFQQAEYVVTDSFHGTMFSLIFERPFNTFIAVSSSSRRILSVLEKFDLLSNIAKNDSDIKESKKFLLSESDIYKILKEESISYLNNIISSK